MSGGALQVRKNASTDKSECRESTSVEQTVV